MLDTNEQQRTVWIVRHTHRQDMDNPHWRSQAVYPDDPDLSPQGHQQAERLGQFFANYPLDHIFCSPFLRAISTAYPIARHKNLPIKIEPGLSEFLSPDYFPGPPQLHDRQLLQSRFPLIDPDYQPRLVPQYPEQDLAAIARAGRVAAQLVAEFPGNLLLVGHGASVWGATWGLLPERPTIQCDLGAIIQIQSTATGWKLLRAGDTNY